MSRDDHTAPLFVEATKQLGALAALIDEAHRGARQGASGGADCSAAT